MAVSLSFSIWWMFNYDVVCSTKKMKNAYCGFYYGLIFERNWDAEFFIALEHQCTPPHCEVVLSQVRFMANLKLQGGMQTPAQLVSYESLWALSNGPGYNNFRVSRF